MTKPLLRATVDASWEQALTMEEYAESNCFSTATLSEAAATLKEAKR
jgi:2-(1,2-epoxy-1,2-dihydrophenyl)acetyl-CoA isomerase